MKLLVGQSNRGCKFKWLGGTLASNGYIYCIFHDHYGLEIDTQTSEFARNDVCQVKCNRLEGMTTLFCFAYLKLRENPQMFCVFAKSL